MSGAFDDLARNLAASMPRGRALRILGGALVVTAVPGLRARPAQAHGMLTCGPGTELCANGKGSALCMPAGGTCCIFPDEIVGCRPGYRCGSGRNNACLCDGDVDTDGTCVKCAGDRRCGKNCCEKNEYCASPNRSKCCRNGEMPCVVVQKSELGRPRGKLECCPSGTTCCANDKRTDCCRPGQLCKDGKCNCPKDTTPCGDKDCCTKGKYCSKGMCCPKNRENCGDGYCCGSNGTSCSNGKCCPKGKVNCGDNRCCAKEDCCKEMCCDGKSRICANGTCCPGERLLGTGKSKRCCPPGTMATSAGTCCPENDPNCCSDGVGTSDEVTVLCRRGQTCVRGVCMRV